ncbi:Protein of unknown function [Cotesia congregata]|uniref:Uncharacterized protein n=1 Tax=Cotesia congregata TaxID=51543 RepID=A0A8J2MIJ2_COTCN|nr:Protein of unknown function [Cotesia congregata]
MKLLILSGLFIAEVTSLLVDSNTPVHLLKTTNSGLIKDTKIGLFDRSKISKFWNIYQTLPSNSIEESAEISRYCNVKNNRVGKILRRVNSKPSEENVDLGIWDTLGSWFSYEPIRRPVKPHTPTPDLYASFDTLNELISRLYAFWEGVDQLYAPLSNPKFKLSIAGVLVPTDPDVFEFLKGSSSFFSWSSGFDYEDVKYSMDSWLYKYKATFSDDDYDLFFKRQCAVFNNNWTSHSRRKINEKYNTEWSSCSQEGLRQYLSNYEPTCLYNKPKSLNM